MRGQEKIFLFTLVLAILLKLNAGKLSRFIDFTSFNLFNRQANCPIRSIEFVITDNKGNYNEQGANYAILFDPKSKELDFKVNVGLAHKLYSRDTKRLVRKNYIPKQFRELLTEENSILDGQQPFAAINGDYIGDDNKPQGLNISRGVEYSGAFKDKRSSFGISGGKPEERKATIQIGKRKEEALNYNVVGGNGRFYQNGKFEDICPALGDYICGRETNRSLVAITSKGYVIFLVNNAADLKKALYPSMFDDVLKGIAANYCLGTIQDGMLFDNGFSTSLYFDKKVYIENTHPVGSAFLIYKKEY